jgi:ubiquinone biosynthesis accessory factor UbiK
MNASLIDDLTTRLKTLIESTPAQELEHNLKALVTGAFTRMDLVTREEFDIQRQVLERTRARVEALEATLADLERRQG